MKNTNTKMNIRQTITTAAVALTMAALIAPAAVGAITAADLQAQINALLAQLQQLQGSSSTSGSVPAACVGITFSRNLTTGATGTDVKCLQVILNMSASTQVSATGAGSPGQETMTFGPKTLAAVQKYQANNGITPASQVGPLTRAKLNTWLGGGSTSSNNNNNNNGQPQGTGPITAMVAGDNPASGNIVGSQASADLLHIRFTGSGTVTSVTLTRTGLSDQNLFTNIYLYDGAMRLTDGYAFNNSGTLTMNGLSIAVNGSRTISVRGDVVASASTSEGNAIVTMTAFTANGTASTVSVMGNTMYVVSASLATVNFSGANASTGSPSINAGTMGYVFWSQTVAVNTRTVWLKAANFKMTGSAPSDALGNIHLFVDGVDTGKVATVNMTNGSNYATFDLTSAPISLSTGSHTVELRADIQKGINRTMQVSIQQASDLMIYDQQVGVNVALGTVSGGTIPSAGANVTIAKGSPTVTIDPAFNALTNITGGSSGAVIGRFIVHAYGDDLKIGSVKIAPVLTTATAGACSTNGSGVQAGTCGLQNVAIYFNGSQVGTTVTTLSGATAFDGSTTTQTYTLGSQMIAPAGQDSILEVRSDLMTTGGVTYTAGTVGVNIIKVTSGATSQGSQDTVDFPTANVTGKTLSIQTGTLTVASNQTNATTSPNTAAVKIGSFVLQNLSTSESVRVTNYAVKLNYANVASNSSTNYSALKTDETSGSGSTPIQPSLCTVAADSGSCTNATDNFTVNFTLAPGATKVVNIYLNTGSTTGATVTVEADLNVSYTGVSSNVPNTTGFQTGAVMTVNTGTLGTAPSLVTSTSTVAQYIPAANGGSIADASRNTFNIVSSSAASTISELKFVDTAATPVGRTVRVGGVSAPIVSGTAYLTGLNLAVPQGSSGLNVDAYVTYPEVSVNGLGSGFSDTLTLAYIKYTSGGTTKTLCTTTIGGCTANMSGGGTGGAVNANAMTLVGSKPAVALGLPNGASGSTMAGFGTGTKYVADITITANAKGDIKVNAIPLTFNTTSTSSVAPSSALNVKDSTGTTVSNATVGSITGNGTAAATATVSFTGGYLIPAGTSQTFRIEVSVTSAAGTGNSIATGIGTASGFTWTDVAGSGSSAAATGTLITNFPTSTVSLTN